MVLNGTSKNPNQWVSECLQISPKSAVVVVGTAVYSLLDNNDD